MATQTPSKTNATQTIQGTLPAPTHAIPLRVGESRPALGPEAFRGFDLTRQMIRQAIDAWFETAMLPSTLFSAIGAETGPTVNVYERDGAYVVECAVPGYKKDEIHVELHGDRVIISGSYTQEQNEEKNAYHRRELRRASFSRVIPLPQEVDPQQAFAKLDGGVLRVTVPPAKAAKSRTVPISA